MVDEKYWNSQAIIEQPPMRRLYNFRGTDYELWMPWMYYQFKHWTTPEWVPRFGYLSQFLSITCSPTQIGTDEARSGTLCQLPLPNLGWETALPCMPSVMGATDWEEGLQETLFFWWAAKSNFDEFPFSSKIWAKLATVFSYERRNGIYSTEQVQDMFLLWQDLGRGQVLDLPWEPLNVKYPFDEYPHGRPL